MSQRPRELLLLTLLHPLIAVLACAASAFFTPMGWLPYLPVVPLLAIVLCQTCLLSLWAVHSTARLWLRGVGLLVWAVFLEVLIKMGAHDDDLNGLAVIAMTGTCALLMASRCRGAALIGQAPTDMVTNPEGFQFSIKSLMVFNATVAILIVGAKALQQYSGAPGFWYVAIWAVCCMIINVLTIGAVLGLAKPWLPATAVMLSSVVLGGIFSFGVANGWQIYVYIVSTMAIQTGLLVASLFVLRGGGYRWTGIKGGRMNDKTNTAVTRSAMS